MSFTIGDRVVYHGWRGDTGEGDRDRHTTQLDSGQARLFC